MRQISLDRPPQRQCGLGSKSSLLPCGWYKISQQKRKRVEEPFGWGKTIGGSARPMLRGVKKLDFKFTLTMAAYDLIKLPRLLGITRPNGRKSIHGRARAQAFAAL